MNRKKINGVTITLYVVFLIGALVFGYLQHIVFPTFRAWIVCVACLIAMLLTGIIRSCLLLADKKKTIKANTVRVVNIKPTRVDGNNASNKSITDELPLVHVDNVDPKRIVISIHKNKSLLTDSVGKVVSQ